MAATSATSARFSEGHAENQAFYLEWKAEKLTPDVTRLELKAPHIAKKAKAGQFVMLTVDEHGERIPLTMADFSAEKGTVTIAALEIGKTTKKLGTLKTGDKLFSLVGPLGLPTERVGMVLARARGRGAPRARCPRRTRASPRPWSPP